MVADLRRVLKREETVPKKGRERDNAVKTIDKIANY
jgi:hypothetical protein